MKDLVGTESSAPLLVNDVRLDAFLAYITVERGLAPNTIEAYGRDLAELRRFLVSQDVNDLRTVGSRHLVSFLTALRERGLSDGSIVFWNEKGLCLTATPRRTCFCQRLVACCPMLPRALKWRLCWRSRVYARL
jgi:hypothetical protein